MTYDLHAVKIAAEAAALQKYGLIKVASRPGLPIRQRLLSAGAGGLIGAAAGGLKGAIEGGDPREDGSSPTLSDRIRAGAKSALTHGGVGAILGGIHGGFGLGRTGLTEIFSSNPNSGLISTIAKETVFGSPVTAYKNYQKALQAGGGSHLKALGTTYRNAYWGAPATGTGSEKLIDYGLRGAMLLPTVSELYGAATEKDPEERKARLATSAVGLIASPLLGNMGIPGILAQQMMMNKARQLVQTAPPARPEPAYDPAAHALLVQRGLMSLKNNRESANTDRVDISST